MLKIISTLFILLLPINSFGELVVIKQCRYSYFDSSNPKSPTCENYNKKNIEEYSEALEFLFVTEECNKKNTDEFVEYIDKLLENLYTEINYTREQNGLRRVGVCPALEVASKTHAMDMYYQDFFGHIGSDGSSYQDRAKRAGHPVYPYGEVILKGPKGAHMKNLVTQMLSNGYSKSIIFNPEAVCMGGGYQLRTSLVPGNYWVMLFSY